MLNGTTKRFGFKASYIRYLRRAGISYLAAAIGITGVVVCLVRVYSSRGGFSWQGMCVSGLAGLGVLVLTFLGVQVLLKAWAVSRCTIELSEREMSLKGIPFLEWSAGWDEVTLVVKSSDLPADSPAARFELRAPDGTFAFEPRELEGGIQLISILTPRLRTEQPRLPVTGTCGSAEEVYAGSPVLRDRVHAVGTGRGATGAPGKSTRFVDNTTRQLRFSTSHVRSSWAVAFFWLGLALVTGAVLGSHLRSLLIGDGMSWQGLWPVVLDALIGLFLLMAAGSAAWAFWDVWLMSRTTIDLSDDGVLLRRGRRSHSASWDHVSLTQESGDLPSDLQSTYQLRVGDSGLRFQPSELRNGGEAISMLVDRLGGERSKPSPVDVDRMLREMQDWGTRVGGAQSYHSATGVLLERGIFGPTLAGTVVALSGVVILATSLSLSPAELNDLRLFAVAVILFVCTFALTWAVRRMRAIRHLALTKDHLTLTGLVRSQTIPLADIVRVALLSSESGPDIAHPPDMIVIETTDARLRLRIAQWKHSGTFLCSLLSRLARRVVSKQLIEAVYLSYRTWRLREKVERDIDIFVFPSLSYPVLGLVAAAMMVLCLYSIGIGEWAYHLALDRLGPDTLRASGLDPPHMLRVLGGRYVISLMGLVAKVIVVSSPVAATFAFVLAPVMAVRRKGLRPLSDVKRSLAPAVGGLVDANAPHDGVRVLYDPSETVSAYAFASLGANYLALTRGILDAFSDRFESLQAIILHELGHIQSRDVHVKNAIDAAYLALKLTLAGLSLQLGLLTAVLLSASRSAADLAEGLVPVIFLSPSLFLWLASRLAIKAGLRDRESRADLAACRRIGDPSLLARAIQEVEQREELRQEGVLLRKSAAGEILMPDPRPGLAVASRTVRRWLSGHPPALMRAQRMRWPSALLEPELSLPLSAGLVIGTLLAALLVFLSFEFGPAGSRVAGPGVYVLLGTILPTAFVLGEFLVISSVLRFSSLGQWTIARADQQGKAKSTLEFTAQRSVDSVPPAAWSELAVWASSLTAILAWVGGVLLPVALVIAASVVMWPDELKVVFRLGLDAGRWGETYTIALNPLVLLVLPAHAFLSSVAAFILQSLILDWYRLRLSHHRAFLAVIVVPTLGGIAAISAFFILLDGLQRRQIYPTGNSAALVLAGFLAVCLAWGALRRFLLMRCPECGVRVSDRFRPGLQCPTCGHRLDSWLRPVP